MKTDITALNPTQLRRAGAREAIQEAKACTDVMERSPQELERVSVHEAGHIAMCELLGIPVNRFLGPGITLDYDEGKNSLGVRMAAVGHENTSRWGTVNPYVALKQSSLIDVAGQAAEFVVYGTKRNVRDWYEDYSDSGLYDRAHNGKQHGLPDLHLSKKELDAKWDADFQTAVSLFRASDARKVLDAAAQRFRTFLTANVHIDLSALVPQHRRSREVTKKVTELTNELMGPQAKLDAMLRYSAARAVMFDKLGVKSTFAGPSIRYKDAPTVFSLTDSIGGLSPDSNWIEKLMRSVKDDPATRTEMLTNIAAAMMVGTVYLYGGADKTYGGIGDSSYTLSSRIVKLFTKYDPEVKDRIDAFAAKQKKANEAYAKAIRAGKKVSSPNIWKTRQKFEKALVQPIRTSVDTSLGRSDVKSAIEAKRKEFERLIAR